MKDKELRKLLENRGILKSNIFNEEYISFAEINKLQDVKIKELREASTQHSANESTLFETNSGLRGKIIELEAKFDAINKHYGITVEHEDAKYTVKEIK